MEFESLITPGDPAFLEFGRKLWTERDDLRAAFPAPDGRAFAKWLAVSGALEYPEPLGRHYPPVPPEDLRRTGCGGATEHGHLWSSLEDFEVVWEAWRLHGHRPFGELGDVLDFGCGSGRLARWLARALPGATVHGCDVRAAGVEWCRQHLPGDFRVSSTTPPLPWSHDSMDLVVALSLFSHFDRDSSAHWLRELARVCRPDGRILVTTHGAFAAWVLARSEEHQRNFFVDAAGASRIARSLQQDGFVFHRPPAAWLAALDGPSPDYGQAFLTEPFARREWRKVAEVVACIPAALFLFQDLYVLKPVKPDRV